MEIQPDWVGKLAFKYEGLVTNNLALVASKVDIHILENLATKDIIRIEWNPTTGSSTSMSGHFIFVNVKLSEMSETVVEKVKMYFGAAYQDVELWLERSRNSLMALHFSRHKEIGTFETVLSAAQVAGFAPFPNYTM